MSSEESEMTIVFVPNDSWGVSSVLPALSNTPPWIEFEPIIDSFVLFTKNIGEMQVIITTEILTLLFPGFHSSQS